MRRHDPGLLKERAFAEGFAALGVASPDAMRPAGDRLRAWVAEGYHGEMGWMAERVAWRSDASALWPEARSVVMLVENYGPEGDPLATLDLRDRATISVYARNRDYHDRIKKRLKRLARWIVEETGEDVKVFVDTAPVMEKPLAALAGLGWQGKHTNLVSRDVGSWAFLGAIFTTLDLPKDAPHPDRCGSCRACLDICPTAAFPAPYRLDARRCIFVSHHRAQGADSAGPCARRWGTGSTGATIASPSVRGTSSRGRRRTAPIMRARR